MSKIIIKGQIYSNNTTDKTLSEENIPADAKKTGDEIEQIKIKMNTKIYGYRVDRFNSDPTTRVVYTNDSIPMVSGGMDLTNNVMSYGTWDTIWFIKNMKPVALKFDGTIDYYLNPNDYSKKLDGTPSDIFDENYNGNFMVMIPLCWVKRWMDSNYEYFLVSDRQVDETFTADAHTNALGDIKDYFFAPLFKGWIDGNGKLRSIAGKLPSNNHTAPEDEASYQALGSGWQCYDLSKYSLIRDLLILVGHSTNIQTVYGRGAVDGYSSASVPNFLPSGGYYDSNTGEYAFEPSGAFNGASDWLHHVKVFHIEDFYGNRYERILGLNCVDGVVYYKTVAPYSIEPDATYTQATFELEHSGGKYITTTAYGEFGSIPAYVGGTYSSGDNKFVCDYCWTATVADGTTVTIMGGSTKSKLYAGPYMVSFTNKINSKGWDYGVSPVYLDPNPNE